MREKLRNCIHIYVMYVQTLVSKKKNKNKKKKKKKKIDS